MVYPLGRCFELDELDVTLRRDDQALLFFILFLIECNIRNWILLKDASLIGLKDIIFDPDGRSDWPIHKKILLNLHLRSLQVVITAYPVGFTDFGNFWTTLVVSTLVSELLELKRGTLLRNEMTVLVHKSVKMRHASMATIVHIVANHGHLRRKRRYLLTILQHQPGFYHLNKGHRGTISTFLLITERPREVIILYIPKVIFFGNETFWDIFALFVLFGPRLSILQGFTKRVTLLAKFLLSTLSTLLLMFFHRRQAPELTQFVLFKAFKLSVVNLGVRIGYLVLIKLPFVSLGKEARHRMVLH